MSSDKMFQIYNAMNLHFTTDSFDAVKYNFKTKAEPKQQHKFRFEKAEKLFDDLLMVSYLIFEENSFKWTTPEQFFAKLNHFRKHKYNPTRKHYVDNNIKSSLKYILQTKKIEQQTDSLYPHEYQLYLDKKVSLASIVALNAYIDRFLVREKSRDIIVFPRFVSWVESKVEPIVKLLITKHDIENIINEMASQTKHQQ